MDDQAAAAGGGRERMIAQLGRARQRMSEVLAELEDSQEVYPGWTVKELIAHLAGWDDAAVGTLRAYSAEEVPPVPAERGIDFYNAQTVLERSELALRQIREEWRQSRAEFVALLEGMPDDLLERTLIFPWGSQGRVAELVAILAHHEEEHAEELRSLFLG